MRTLVQQQDVEVRTDPSGTARWQWPSADTSAAFVDVAAPLAQGERLGRLIPSSLTVYAATQDGFAPTYAQRGAAQGYFRDFAAVCVDGAWTALRPTPRPVASAATATCLPASVLGQADTPARTSLLACYLLDGGLALPPQPALHHYAERFVLHHDLVEAYGHNLAVAPYSFGVVPAASKAARTGVSDDVWLQPEREAHEHEAVQLGLLRCDTHANVTLYRPNYDQTVLVKTAERLGQASRYQAHFAVVRVEDGWRPLAATNLWGSSGSRPAPALLPASLADACTYVYPTLFAAFVFGGGLRVAVSDSPRPDVRAVTLLTQVDTVQRRHAFAVTQQTRDQAKAWGKLWRVDTHAAGKAARAYARSQAFRDDARRFAPPADLDTHWRHRLFDRVAPLGAVAPSEVFCADPRLLLARPEDALTLPTSLTLGPSMACTYPPLPPAA